ncbi:MAG: PKD domain-containing protein, partial [Flavobacteriales bacterium]|nr:PKD domain-containing protein [Flavobacteriales bacterium]
MQNHQTIGSPCRLIEQAFRLCDPRYRRTVVFAVLILARWALSSAACAQAYVIFNGTDNTCVGAFLDSGGQGGSGYSNNEDYTYTICPDIPGDAISVNFITALMATNGAAPIDNMTIYDGDNTGAPLIGNWTGSTLQGQVISASAGNVTGCLTFVWHSNNAGLGIFAGSITCTTPCARPTAVASMVGGAPAKICVGEAVNFNGNASFAAPGFSIAQWLWDFDDGTTSSIGPVVSHVFNIPGEYVVQLYLEDNNGCASTNLVDLQVLVGTEPTFTGTGGEQYGCLGETLCLDGQVNGVTWSATPDANYGAGVLLPDNVGSCFISELTFSQFAPGQTLNNINDLNAICFDIEHSFLGDLIISIISPSGETVILHQQGGTGTFLGIPDDFDDANPNPGTCWTYCIDPFATNGTMAANAGVTLPAGSYESVDPLTGLLGSSLNGTWTLQICDMWALDNGFLCGFSLDFDPSLFPGLTEFTPVYGNACDSTWWSGPNITSASGDCDQICVTPPGVGNFNYVYHAIDNFGCTYDTTVVVTIIPGPTVNAGADQTICTPGDVQLNAVVNGIIPPAPCTYTLNLFDTFGDGWDGATVTVTVNGVPTVYGMANGTNISYTINVLDGQTLQISYQPSLLFNAEHAYELLDGLGNTVFSDTPPMASGVTFNGIADCAPGNGSIIYAWTPTTGLNNAGIANPIASVATTTTYTVTIYQDGYSGCPATSTVTITVGSNVDAGTPGAITLCSTDAAVSLFAQLGGTPDAGGTWIGPSAVVGGMFDPSSMNAGAYVYTVTGTAPCPDATATVTTTINTPPDPGVDGNLTVCSTDGVVDLFAELGGTPDAGGTWTAPGGGAFGVTFTPGTDADGIYTYTVNGTAPCPSETATVTMTTNTPPDPGVDGAITFCSTDAAVSLFTQLGGTPDAGGTWIGPSPVVGGMFDPASMNAGAYVYTVTGTAPCPDETATVTTTINTPPDPGTDGNPTVCSTDGVVDLFAELGGTPDAGGSWTAPGGGAFGATFTPGTDVDGAYTYTVNGIAPCPSETATVTMTTNTPPDPGVDGAITLCSTDAAVSLFPQLGGTPDAGGTWSGPSPVVGGMFDPAGMTAGVYTYTVTGTAPCPDGTATVTTTINTPPDPGVDGALTVCNTSGVVDLFAQLGGTPDAGGTWTAPGGGAFGATFTPGTDADGVYTYTVNGVAPCPSETATVSMTTNTPPDPGVDGAITLCSTDAAVSLFAQLGGTPDAGGTWSGPSPVAGGMFDPSSMIAGAYVYTITGTAPCPNEVATVTTTINTPPDPGVDGALTVCSTDGVVDLFAQLGGTPNAGGSWTAPGGGAFGATFTPGTDADGVYTYTVNGTAPCPS